MRTLFQDLSDFLSLLQRRQQVLEKEEMVSAEGVPSSLNYANALLRHQIQRLGDCPLPIQVVVIGPTQSGKSSVVNLMLDTAAAEASPLAGFTRHAQGFSIRELADQGVECLERMLANRRRIESSNAQLDDSGIFSLSQIAASGLLSDRAAVVWDTPDFDSVSSRAYRETVPEVCALADTIVLVVCREKYADRSVWQMLKLVSRMDIPLFVCMNRANLGERATLVADMQKRLREAAIPCAGIFALPYIAPADGRLEDAEEAAMLRSKILSVLPGSAVPRRSEHFYELLASQWADWTLGVQLELSAAEEWSGMVRSAVDESLALYERDYLDSPHASDTLQRAILQLLHLLEIPGIAPTITRVRSVLTWPVRKLQDLVGRKWQGGRPKDPLEQERRVLEEAISHLLVSLRYQANKKLASTEGASGTDWWVGLLQIFEAQEPNIRTQALDAISVYQSEFEHDIESAGRRLYEHLQQHPATLNGLRAARVTTDAAGVVLAVKTGGIGVNDLILTPAMLSITSLLAEGAVGQYMKQVEKELRERQFALVGDLLFRKILEARLAGLPGEIPNSLCLQIPQQLVEKAASALSRLKSSAGETAGG